jgi:serine/threonine-protein kinase
MTKEIVGSPKFMPPEAFISLKRTDERSDIFSFGILSYIIATNQHPFDGDTLEDIIQSVSTQKPVKPSLLNKDIPPEFDDLLAGMLAKYQSQRYQSMEDVIEDLKLCCRGNGAKGTFLGSIFRRLKHFSSKNQWCREQPTKYG